MALTTEQLDILAAGGEVDLDLPEDPGVVSPDGIFFEDVFFETADGNSFETVQGLLSLTTLDDLSWLSSAPDAEFIARNADVIVGDDFGGSRTPSAIVSISGPSASLMLPGQDGSSSQFRLVAGDGSDVVSTWFISDGAQVSVAQTDPDEGAGVSVGRSWGAFLENGSLRGDPDIWPGGQSVDGTLIVEGAGTTLSVTLPTGGRYGDMIVGEVGRPDEGIADTTTNRTADGLAIVRDGAEVNIHQYVGLGDANGIEGATANGTLIVEGAGTTVNVGTGGDNVTNGFMRIAEEGGRGLFILRDGAEFNLLAGSEYGGGMQLSGGGERDGGDATAIVTGADTKLFLEEGSIHVGRNGGTASFTISDQAMVETRYFATGQSSIGETTITGAGTIVTLNDGSGGSMDIGLVRDGDTPENLTADGTVTISDGAEVNIRQYIGLGDANNVAGASATGTLIVEGADTTVTVGTGDSSIAHGSMSIAEEGGQGVFILRNGAEFNLLAGSEFGGDMNLSGGSDRAGGDATAIVSGEGTRLFLEQGNLQVGRNGGEASFTASDGASVEALFFSSGRLGNAESIFEGEGTSLTLSGAQITPGFGAFLNVGRDSEGTFTLRDGADVTITGDGGNYPGFGAGRSDGSNGVITVTGAGSTITIDGAANADDGTGNTGFIRAGRDTGSDGTINVLDGGVVTNDDTGTLIVAQEARSTGAVNVDGEGSIFDFGATATLSQNVEDGDRGDAIVTISNGGLLRGNTVVNNGILDLNSGGRLEANLTQEGLLRSSGGVEAVVIDGDLTHASAASAASLGFDASMSGAGFSYDTYTFTGSVNLDGTMFIIGESLAALQGLSAEVISGATLVVGDTFSVQFFEADADALNTFNSNGVAAPVAETTELSFTTTATGLIIDFGMSAAQIGSAGSETLTGTAGGDRLEGLAGDDMLEGQAGNDIIVGGAGNDTIDGGDGIDTAIYSGPQTSYTLTLSASGATIADRRADENGTDMLSGIEFLDFDTDLFDGPFNLSVFSDATNLSQSDFESFIELYIAYFNRAPDAVGLNFWGTAFANGAPLSEIALLFIDQDETRALYPESQTNVDFVTAVYNNVFGRIPDQAGFDFWVGVLADQDSGVGRDQFILAALGGARAAPDPDAEQSFIDQQLADQKYLSDKTDIGAYYAVHQGLSDVGNASAAMAIFDGSQGSVTAAVAAIDDFYLAALGAENGEFIMPLVGVLDDPFSVV